eukprot:6931643-Heterocapsa_arctica.AAC.1
MKCHNCGSDQHLIRDCDKPKSQQQTLLATGADRMATLMVPATARGSSYGGYSFFHSATSDNENYT